MTEPEAPVPPSPEPPPPPAPEPREDVPVPGRKPHLPAWVAYGGIALVLLMLGAVVVVKFVLPEDQGPRSPDKPGPVAVTPEPKQQEPKNTEPKVTEPKVTEPKVTEPKLPVKPVSPQDAEKLGKALEEGNRLYRDSRYDEAYALVKKAVEEYGDSDGSAAKFLTKVKERIDQVQEVYVNGMNKARAAVQEGRLHEGIEIAQAAGRYYPERAEASLKEFHGFIRTTLATDRMIQVLGRKFEAGSPDDKEFPPREVSVESFMIEPTEVTIEKYSAFCLITGRPLPQRWQNTIPNRLNHPVTNVTLDDARAYAAWIGRRLPTADEWELAARYIDGRAFPWGNRFQMAPDEPFRANTDEYSQQRGGWGTMPVGHFAAGASPFQLMDMAGNVWEWTDVGRADGLQLMKGGSFKFKARSARTYHGMYDDPGLEHADVGFRCVRGGAP